MILTILWFICILQTLEIINNFSHFCNHTYIFFFNLFGENYYQNEIDEIKRFQYGGLKNKIILSYIILSGTQKCGTR